MSEAAGRDVGTTAAARDYIKKVLPDAPEPLEPVELVDSGRPLAEDDSLAAAD